MKNWMGNIKFRLLLWILGWRMVMKSRGNTDFKQALKDKDIVLQIQTMDDAVARHFVIQNQTVRSRSGHHSQPSLAMSFQDAAYAVETLLKRDNMAFMTGVQKQLIAITGDFSLLMWFVGAVKKLK